MFKRILILALGVLLLAAPAMAASPHFLWANAELKGDQLVVTFKEAGLGNGDITIEASAFATVTYSCVNGGNHVPRDPKKTVDSATVTATDVFSPKNGNIVGKLTLTLPPTTLICPPGQRATRMSFAFTDVTVHDLTNDVSISVEGYWSGN